MKRTCRSIFFAITLLFSLMCYGQLSHADMIWDTGAASTVEYPYGYILMGGEYAQYAAGRFYLSEAYTITAIQGWISTQYSTGGSLSVAVYTQNESTDTPGTFLYRSNPFNLAQELIPAWYGTSSLSWNLGPGYYWVSFEPIDVNFGGQMSTLRWMENYGVYGWPPNPMPSYKFYYNGTWNQYGGMYGSAVGMRIEGTPGGESPPTTTPEPATMLLLGFGILGLAGARRFRK